MSKRNLRRMKERELQIARAREAGALIAFFLAGGNGVVFRDVESARSGAVIALSKVASLIDPDRLNAVMDACGLEWYYTNSGARVMRFRVLRTLDEVIAEFDKVRPIIHGSGQ